MIYEICWYDGNGEDMQFFAELTDEQADAVRRRLQAARNEHLLGGNRITPLTVLSPIDLNNSLDEWLNAAEDDEDGDGEAV